MQATKVSVICSVIATLLPTTAASNTIRNLEDESDSATAGGISTVSIACVAAAAAVVIALLVVVKVRATGNVNARKEVEMHEVVISPSQPIGLQPMSTKKQFVYTAHI
ncbi:hypothetical protein PHYBOEH_000415 [Phytophthora boehmeriae]|uniref:Membrane-associated protein n=1 Tax=Phytophthora boehmeriae TaxID=109152 RepID=A0A8T1WW44_9STRA|nr:hypothetical protein PHYBOEH_000415 [Phytophthora boehmeriae]